MEFEYSEPRELVKIHLIAWFMTVVAVTLLAMAGGNLWSPALQ